MSERMGVVESLRRDPGDEQVNRYKRLALYDLARDVAAEEAREIIRALRRQGAKS